MITYCSKCGINWARLTVHNCDGDEQVEVCPVCYTDTFLEDGNDIDSYIRCPFTGKITSVLTGRPYGEDPAIETKPVIRVVVGKPARETVEEREARELAAIEAYQASGKAADYFSTIKKQK